MERLKNITIVFLTAVGFLTSTGPAKTVSVLLQEGFYAEEIEGNLDAAIKIYEQVIGKSKETQQAAAQATYRIGMCYLKKGEKAKASIQFSNLVSKFPEQKPIVDKARKQLAKLRPPIRVFEPQALVEQIKAGTVPSFEVQLPDNTGLDLDTGEIAMFKDKWPNRFDVAWDNDGGGVLMKKAGSGVRFLALPGGDKQMWDEAVYIARSQFDELRNSNTKVIWAGQGKFAAVLTSEENLAVIQIAEYDAEQGTIYGWVEKIPAEVYCFGPVKEVTLYDIEHTITKGKPCAINFATGKVTTFSRQHQMSEFDIAEWVRRRGIDAVAETGNNKSNKPSLMGFDLAVVSMPSEVWDTITPAELRTLQGSPVMRIQECTLMSYYEGQDQPVYAFRTRKGQYGIFQIIDFNKQAQDVRFRYKMLQPVAGKEMVKLKLTKPWHEWWQSEPSVTNTIYEDSQLEIVWDVEPEMAKNILSFGGGVLPMKGDISDIKGHLWWVRNLAFTVRRTPYGKKWGISEEPKPLKSGEYRIYICAFDSKENIVWRDMLGRNLVGAATAKLIVRPRPSTKIATPREVKSPIDLSSPEATIKSFVKAVYDGNLEAAGACVSKDGHDYDEFMEMLTTESNHPFQAMIKAMDASIPVEITGKDITEDRCKIKWYFTLGRVYYIGDGETKWKKGMHPEFSSYLELVGDKWLIRDI